MILIYKVVYNTDKHLPAPWQNSHGSSWCNKHHVLYCHVNTNNIQSQPYTPLHITHCPHNPGKPADIFQQQSERNISISCHTKLTCFSRARLSSAEWSKYIFLEKGAKERSGSLSFKDIMVRAMTYRCCVGVFSLEKGLQKKWHVLLPFPFAIRRRWLSVCCLLCIEKKVKGDRLVVFWTTITLCTVRSWL